MTGTAGRIATVITGIGARAVCEADRQPVVGTMAFVALHGGYEVIRRLARGRTAIVAGRTGARRNRTVIEARRYPTNG